MALQNDSVTSCGQVQFGSGGPQDFFYSSKRDSDRLTLVKGDGIYLWDEEGKRYIDASSGPVTCNIGHNNPRVIDAMHQQVQQLAFAFPSSARNLPNIQLADKLTGLAGKGFERALFVSGGSEAVDMAIKFCRQYRYATGEIQRYKLITCQPSYHGMTLGTLAASGDPVFGDIFGDMITMAHKIPAMFRNSCPDGVEVEQYAIDCASKLEEKILVEGPESVLAFIIEPVGGSASGANAPPEVYFNEIRRICDKYGVFLIYDEVMSGVGRTGSFLTSQLWPHARPDISVIAKGLGAGYIPLGAMMAPAELVDELADLTGFNYAHTYNASPLACAVGIAVLDEITQNNLFENTCEMGSYLASELKDLQAKTRTIGDIRGKGLLLGVELVASRTTMKSLPLELNAIERIKALAQAQGLLIYGRRSNNGAFGDTVLVAPPLNINKVEVDAIVEKFTATIMTFEAELNSLGL